MNVLDNFPVYKYRGGMFHTLKWFASLPTGPRSRVAIFDKFEKQRSYFVRDGHSNPFWLSSCLKLRYV